MPLNLSKKTIAFLKERSNEKFSARDIALWVFKNNPSECAQKKEKSKKINTDEELINQIISEISSNYSKLKKNNHSLRSTPGKPKKYYYSEQQN